MAVLVNEKGGESSGSLYSALDTKPGQPKGVKVNLWSDRQAPQHDDGLNRSRPRLLGHQMVRSA